ncbi:hypothetical protein B0H12DRAFT_373949 [Mycena haematopus]|nr:hypothetical protein B0H12DRAFT_373949 [Mycena haematopus]
MHPSLSLTSLACLPPCLRASAMVAASGSYQETLAIVKNVSESAPTHLPFLLPIFHTILDPARIPMILTRFESFGWASIRDDIYHAHFCLVSIRNMGMLKAISPDAFGDLWRHAWPWIKFLDEYEETLSNNNSLSAETRYAGFVSLMAFLRGQEPTIDQVRSTTGLYVVVGRAWQILVRAEDPPGIADVSYFLALWFKDYNWNSASFEELIIGVGGTLADLAAIVVAHIKRVLPHPDSAVTERHVFHLVGIICLVAPESLTRPLLDVEFKDALLSCGIVPTLTTASRALCRSALVTAGVAVKAFFPALVDQIVSFPPIWLPESLRAGLLEILFTSHHRESIYPLFIDLLEGLMSPHSVYHSVLTQLRTSLPQVRDQNAAAIFSDATLLARWESFLQVVEDRFRILDEYNAGVLNPPRGCDDLECLKICAKQELKRCSGCRTAHYCSSTCQSNDWRHGGHRQTCGDLASHRKESPRTSSRDRSFLRALMHHQSTMRAEEIAHKHRIFIQTYPGEAPCTVFDFTTGACRVEVVAIHWFLQSQRGVDANGATSRVARIELHLMKVMQGRKSVVWPFPHCASGKLHQESSSSVDTLDLGSRGISQEPEI